MRKEAENLSSLWRNMQKRVPDYWLAILYLFFTSLGILLVYSATYSFSLTKTGDPFFLFKRHIAGVTAGIGFLIAFYYIPIEMIRKKLPYIMLFTFILLFLPLFPGIGSESGGARRWINFFFFSFQPSEVAKLVVIIYLASILEKNQEHIKEYMKGTLIPFLVCVVFAGIILLQKDFSTATFFVMATFIMLYIAGAKFLNIFMTILFTLPVLWLFVVTSGYRLSRVHMLLNMDTDPQGAYQLFQSLEAFRRGGFLGEGLGRGVKNIPYMYNDFIFSVSGEEIGLLGCLLILILFVFLWQRGVAISKRYPERSFHSTLAFGLVFLLVAQALINISVSLAIVPPTGVTLPFLSYGRTSFMISSACVGILLQLSRKEKEAS